MANYSKEFDLIYLPLQKKYRNQMEIIALILNAAGCNGAALYSLMKRASINYTQLKKYLPFLIKIGFLEAEVRESKILFRTSEQGFAFLRQYNILREMLLSVYLGNRLGNAVKEENGLAKIEQRATLPLSLRGIRRR